MEGSQHLPVSDGDEGANLFSSQSISYSTYVDSMIITPHPTPLSPNNNNSCSSNPLFTSLFDLNTVARPKKYRSVSKFVKEVVVQRRPVFKGTHVAFEEETIEYDKEIEESTHKNNKDLKINLFKGCKPLDPFTGKLALMPLHRTNRELEIKHGGFNSEAKESYKKSTNEVLLSRGKDFRKEIHDIINISAEFRLRTRPKLPLSHSLLQLLPLSTGDIVDARYGEVKVADYDVATPDLSTDVSADVERSLLNSLGTSNITADKSGQIVQTIFPESTLSLGDYRYNSMKDGKSLANLSKSPLYWCRKSESKSKPKPKPSSGSPEVMPSKNIVESEDDKEVVLFKESRLISETYCQITIIGVNITGRLFNTNNTDSIEGDSENNNYNFYGAGSRISRYIRVEVYSFWSCQKHELVLTVNEVKSLVANITAVCTVSRRLGPPEMVANSTQNDEEKAPRWAENEGRTLDDADVLGDITSATAAVAVPANANFTSKKAKYKGKEIKVKSIAPTSIEAEEESKEQLGLVGEVPNHNPSPAYSDNGHYRIFDEDERKLWFLLRPGNRTLLMSRVVDSLFFRYTIMCEKGQRLAAKAKFKKKNLEEEIVEEAPLIGSIGADGKKVLSPTEIRRAEKKRLAKISTKGPPDPIAKDVKNISDTYPKPNYNSRKNSSKEINPSVAPVRVDAPPEADFYLVGQETKDEEDDGSVASHQSLQLKQSSLNEYNEKVTVIVDHLEDPVLPEGYPKTVHSIMTLINNNCRFSDDQSGNPMTLYVPHLSESLTLGPNKLESSRAKRARLLQALLEKRERENIIIRKKWKEVIPRKRGLVFSKVIKRLGRHLRVRIYNGGLDYLLQPPREDTKRVLVVDFVRDGHSVVLNVGYSTLFTYSGLTSELHFSQWSEETLLRTYRNMTKAIAIQLVQDDDVDMKNKASSKLDPMGYSRAKEVLEAKEIAANKDFNEEKTQTMTIRLGKLCSAQFDSYPLDGLSKIRKFKGHLATSSSANSSLKISEKEKNDLVTTLDTRDWFYINFGGNVNLRRCFTIDTEFLHHRDSIVMHAYQMYPPNALTPPTSDMFCLEMKQKGAKQNPQKHLKFPSSSSLDICNSNVRLLRVLKRLGGVVCIVTVYLISKPISIKTSREVPIFNADDYLKKPAEVPTASVTNPDSNSVTTAAATTAAAATAINPDVDPNYVDPYAEEPPPNEPSVAAVVPKKSKKAPADDDMSAMMFAPPPCEGGEGGDSKTTTEPDLTGPKQSFYDTFAQETIFRIAIHRTDNCFSSIKENDYFSKYDYYFDLTRDSFFSFFLSDEGLLYGAYQCSYEIFFEDLGTRVTADVVEVPVEKDLIDDDKEEEVRQRSDGTSVGKTGNSDSTKLKKRKKNTDKLRKNEENKDGIEPKSNVIVRPVVPYPHCVLSWDDCRSIWERVLTQLFSTQLFTWTLGLAPSTGKLPKSREKKVYNPDDDNDDDYFAAAIVVEEIRVFTPLTVPELIKCCYYTGTDGLNGKPDRVSPSPSSAPLTLMTMNVSEDTVSLPDDLALSAPVAPIMHDALEQANSADHVVASAPQSQTSTASAQGEIMILLPALSTIVMKGNFRMRFSDHIYTRYGKPPSEPLSPKVEVVRKDEEEDDLDEEEDSEDDEEVGGEGKGGGGDNGRSNTKKGDDDATPEVGEPNMDDCKTEEEMIAMMAEMERKMVAKAAELEKKRLEKIAANQAVVKKDSYKKQRKNTRAMLVYVWQLENEMGLVVYDPVSNTNYANITNAIMCFRPPLVVQAMHISMTRFMTPIDRYNYYKLYCMHELRICKVHNDGVFTNDREVVATNGSD